MYLNTVKAIHLHIQGIWILDHPLIGWEASNPLKMGGVSHKLSSSSSTNPCENSCLKSLEPPCSHMHLTYSAPRSQVYNERNRDWT